MFRRIKVVAWTAVTVALLSIGSTAMAAPGLRGGYGYGRTYAGYGYGGYGYGYGSGSYLSGYGLGGGLGIGGYGGYYGSYYPGYYGGGYRYYPRYYASRQSRRNYPYPRGYYGNYHGYYGGSTYPFSGGSNHSAAPLVYLPPPVVFSPLPRRADTTPETKITAAKVTVAKVTVANPVVPAPIAPVERIKLMLPATGGDSVRYELNGKSYVMKPRHAQTFANDRSWTIAFDDGTGRMESQALPAGTYAFTKNAEGRWELRTY